MDYLKIKNWERWQTYRSDRGQPPWIKVHRRIRLNPEWVELSDAERGQLIAMWLLAADKDGVIPASPELIQKLCFMTAPPDINKFIELDFIENGWRRDGVVTASERQPDGSPEENRKEENRKEYSADFLEFYNAYPNKKEKPKAYQRWLKLKKAKKLPSLNVLLSAIQKQKLWRADANGEFRPEWKHPATWLNAGCWDDETECKPKIQKVYV